MRCKGGRRTARAIVQVCIRVRVLLLGLATSISLSHDQNLPLRNCRSLTRITLSGSCTRLPWTPCNTQITKHRVAQITCLNALDLKFPADGVMAAVNELVQLKELEMRATILCSTHRLALLAHLSTLQTLRISSRQLLDGDLVHMSALCRLQTLDLTHCEGVTGFGLLHLSHLSGLRHLCLRRCSWVNASGLELGRISSFSSLASLDLSHCECVGNHAVSCLSPLTSLRVLILSFCKRVTNEGWGHLTDMQQLQELHVHAHKCVTSEGVAHLSQLRALQKLSLSHCTNVDDEALSHISHLTGLRHLDLRGCSQVTDRGVAQLAALTALQSINLCHLTNLTSQCLEHIVQLQALEEVRIGCFPMTRRSLSCLAQLPALKRLALDACSNVTGLACLTRNSALTELSLNGCVATSSGALHKLRRITTLRTLCMVDCQASRVGIAEIGRLTSLRCLTLRSSDDDLTHKYARHTARLPALRSSTVYLCRGATNRDIAHLAALTALQRLDLCGCVKVTDSGIAALTRLSALTALDVSCCVLVSHAGLAHLRLLRRPPRDQRVELPTAAGGDCQRAVA